MVERGAFRADQFNHSGNFRAHYLHTGPEIIQQVRISDCDQSNVHTNLKSGPHRRHGAVREDVPAAQLEGVREGADDLRVEARERLAQTA